MRSWVRSSSGKYDLSTALIPETRKKALGNVEYPRYWEQLMLQVANLHDVFWDSVYVYININITT